MSRIITTVLALLILAGVTVAQDLEASYQEKLKKEFMTKVSWVATLDEAMKISEKTGKPIFGYFTRSYAP